MEPTVTDEQETTMDDEMQNDDPGMEAAWGLIANAYGGDWSQATPEWREAAERWRDECWHPFLDRRPTVTDQTAAEWRGSGAELLREIQANVGCRGAADWLASLRLGPSDVMEAVRAAVAAEREACAGAVDEMCDDVDDPFMYGTLRAVAAAIRNRGEADRD